MEVKEAAVHSMWSANVIVLTGTHESSVNTEGEDLTALNNTSLQPKGVTCRYFIRASSSPEGLI